MHCEVRGRTDGAQTIVLVSGLGGAAHYWAPQMAALEMHFRVLSYDQRGVGRSGGMVPEGYSIADMAAELGALLDQHDVSRCHLIGHALGGLIGLHLASTRPELFDRMVLVNAWARTHPHTLRCFAIRKHLLLNTGPEAYVHAQPLFLYPSAWLADRQDWLREQDAAGVVQFPPTETVLRRIGAIEAFKLDVGDIDLPTLVIATRDDLLVPFTCSVELAGALPNAELMLPPYGGHAFNITDPASFNAMVLPFLTHPDGKTPSVENV